MEVDVLNALLHTARVVFWATGTGTHRLVFVFVESINCILTTYKMQLIDVSLSLSIWVQVVERCLVQVTGGDQTSAKYCQ